MNTVWEYSLKTEAERLLHSAHQIAIGFYRVNNFLVLPYTPKNNGVNIVTFPDLPYNKIPRFWNKVNFVDIVNLPIKVSPKLVSETEKLLAIANLPKPAYSATEKKWNKAQDEIVAEIYKIMPLYKNKIKKIVIYPTAFGTGSSFNLIDKNGEVKLYLRQDKGIAEITESVVTSLTRKDIYDEFDGIWSESEIITDWLITKTSISKKLEKYGVRGNYLPTIKGVRIKEQAKLLKQSEDFYKKLGLSIKLKMFTLNGLVPEIYKKPIQNLSSIEKELLKLLIENNGKIVTFEEIGDQIFKNDDNYSLYAIAKQIQRLRNKLEANGVSGSYIQTLRGKGYLLKN